MSSPNDKEEGLNGTLTGKRKASGNAPKSRAPWTKEESDALAKAVLDINIEDNAEDEADWDAVAAAIPGKSAVQCYKQFMNVIKNSPEDSNSEEDEDKEESPISKKQKLYSDVVWDIDEEDLLKKLMEEYKNKDSSPRWNDVAANFKNKSAIECLTKWQSISNPPVLKGKGSWTAEEDAILMNMRTKYGKKWSKIASHLPGRQGKQCRERFVNHLDPRLKKGEWTDDEEAILIAMHKTHGNRWANISKHLPGRSDNDVKNHWYSTIQRKFQQHGKEKLIQAALQQVQIMQNMGTLPNQQQPPQWPPGPYNQATQHPSTVPPAYPPHPPYPPPPHSPNAPGYPYHPPTHQPHYPSYPYYYHGHAQISRHPGAQSSPRAGNRHHREAPVGTQDGPLKRPEPSSDRGAANTVESPPAAQKVAAPAHMIEKATA